MQSTRHAVERHPSSWLSISSQTRTLHVALVVWKLGELSFREPVPPYCSPSGKLTDRFGLHLRGTGVLDGRWFGWNLDTWCVCVCLPRQELSLLVLLQHETSIDCVRPTQEGRSTNVTSPDSYLLRSCLQVVNSKIPSSMPSETPQL